MLILESSKGGETMTGDHNCTACSTGCAERHSAEKTSEEIKSGPYLLFSAILIVVLAAAFKYLF
jgi:hypothetical protein